MNGMRRLTEVENKIRARQLMNESRENIANSKPKREVINMFGMKTLKIAENERALLFQDRNFKEVLEPGKHRYFDFGDHLEFELYNLAKPEFDHRLLGLLIRDHRAEMEKHFKIVDLGEFEVGLVYKDGKLTDLLPPNSRRVFWTGVVNVEVVVQDISESYEIPADKLLVLAHATGTRCILELAKNVVFIEVSDNYVGLMNVNGKLERVLEPGFYGFWRFNRNLEIDLIDTRLKSLEVQGQEILSKDKVSLRVNLTAGFRVSDPVKAQTELSNTNDYLYRELQFALRSAIGTRTLDELLVNKDEINTMVFDYIREKTADYGIHIDGVGVKDIILPGDMKLILNQVVEAEKSAQANLIKRREETAATRSLLNTAKVMENNPTLLRLKELEVLEKVTEKVDSITVYGGMDSILQELVKIKH